MLQENQIDFDFVPADLLRDPEAFALDKKLHINGESFSALVVPSFDHITEAVLRFTEKALEKGFPVFFADKMPAVAGAKENRSPSGTVVPLAGITNALRNAGASDIKLSSQFTSLRYYRYRHDNEIYIFSNESLGETFTGVVTVPTEGDACIYDAYDNVLRPLSFRGIHGGTELTLTVRPFEPVIVVFGDKGNNLTPYLSTNGIGLEIKNWEVSICESKEYPAFHDGFKTEVGKCDRLVLPVRDFDPFPYPGVPVVHRIDNRDFEFSALVPQAEPQHLAGREGHGIRRHQRESSAAG
jgi:hypothetical protein